MAAIYAAAQGFASVSRANRAVWVVTVTIHTISLLIKG
jgi:hypothetical protein